MGFLLLALGVGKSDAFRVLAWSRRPQVRAAPNIVSGHRQLLDMQVNEIASMAALDADLKERDLALSSESAAAAQKKSTSNTGAPLAESVDDAEALRRTQLANLEGKAEALAAQGLQGAVEAFDELLKLQPHIAGATGRGARRALQQLLLESMRRELARAEARVAIHTTEPAGANTQRAQAMGEDTRRRLAQRALEDVSRIRSLS